MSPASDVHENAPVTVTEQNKSAEQKAAEAEVESFRKDPGPFVIPAETTRMAMMFMDAKEPDHPIIFANDRFVGLTGYSREEVLAKTLISLMADLSRSCPPRAAAALAIKAPTSCGAVRPRSGHPRPASAVIALF